MPESSNGPGPQPPENSPERRAGLGLLAQARAGLAEARFVLDPGERFRLAHLAALRVAAALFAARSRPATRPRRLKSAWALVEAVAPELSELGRLLCRVRGHPGRGRGRCRQPRVGSGCG